MTVGERIRDARKAKGLTQNELAMLLGVTQPMIVQYEQGIRNPKVDTLEKIATVLETSYRRLISDFPEPNEQLRKLSELLSCDIEYLLENVPEQFNADDLPDIDALGIEQSLLRRTIAPTEVEDAFLWNELKIYELPPRQHVALDAIRWVMIRKMQNEVLAEALEEEGTDGPLHRRVQEVQEESEQKAKEDAQWREEEKRRLAALWGKDWPHEEE